MQRGWDCRWALEDGEGLAQGLETSRARGVACGGLCRGEDSVRWGSEDSWVHFSNCYKYPSWYLKLPGILKTWEKETKTNLRLN